MPRDACAIELSAPKTTSSRCSRASPDAIADGSQGCPGVRYEGGEVGGAERLPGTRKAIPPLLASTPCMPIAEEAHQQLLLLAASSWNASASRSRESIAALSSIRPAGSLVFDASTPIAVAPDPACASVVTSRVHHGLPLHVSSKPGVPKGRVGPRPCRPMRPCLPSQAAGALLASVALAPALVMLGRFGLSPRSLPNARGLPPPAEPRLRRGDLLLFSLVITSNFLGRAVGAPSQRAISTMSSCSGTLAIVSLRSISMNACCATTLTYRKDSSPISATEPSQSGYSNKVIGCSHTACCALSVTQSRTLSTPAHLMLPQQWIALEEVLNQRKKFTLAKHTVT